MEKGRNKETVRMRHGEGEGEHDRITGDSEQEVPDQGQLDQIGTQSSGHRLEQISQSDQPNTASSGHWTLDTHQTCSRNAGQLDTLFNWGGRGGALSRDTFGILKVKVIHSHLQILPDMIIMLLRPSLLSS